MAIFLNDILKIENFADVRIRFNLQMNGNYNPIDAFDKNNLKKYIDGHYWNYPQRKSFKLNQRTLGFIPYDRKDNTWLLFHAGKVIKDLNILNGVGYDYSDIEEFSKYCGRLIIRYKNKSRNPIFYAETCINDCEVVEILPDIYDDDVFPGYENVNISWEKLSRVISKESWKTALQNQKGVYLITDKKTGKMYVGSAYGENMLLGRWTNYAENCHGGNVDFKKLKPNYIKSNFQYTILEIFKSTTADEVIINRESWWKNVLMTRDFGYNNN
ncbi:conserved hypothetical protein [Fibrobacter succinogenes subsp. succinogenes S85]|uniref:GIY-YIG domain-containing protein n=1 Tax=Fibrobacter succinogenes (strain ATCC 19169 / S85) TaxID=59374 RepID=C9RKJ1_FIBSS|nr:GIY-YIG nuclease family protein [Fibrobacter succinogenes]ACX73919.1 conserved hypothetical protein [Fibrobacter succinogenes subsp. succinogenes S85]ADL25481.1 conserved hypothetical protein [Fibrobacter succinogenes subsp. succinogenes S85]